jgi:sialate O-acetylesterase
MVLQRDKPIAIWGWAEANETVSLQLAGIKLQVNANDKGEWKVLLPPIKAGGPAITLTVSGSNTVEFEDILIGDVWLCSGQSNMEMGIGACQNAKEEIAAATHPNLRLLMIPNRWTPQPEKDFVPSKSGAEGTWKVCSPSSVGEAGWNGFSAAAYYFGRELEKQLGVPIGLIDATWGGTRIESWTPPEGFAEVRALAKDYEFVQLADPRSALHKERLGQILKKTDEWLVTAREALSKQTLVPAMPTYPAELLPPRDVQNPTALFNGMIRPLCPFGLRGAIWYQGESNAGEGRLYTDRMKALIAGWRKIWGEGDFPFYFVQIAPYNYGGDAERIGEFWEAQAEAAKEIPNTGMAVISDIGNLKDIHPANKQEVGRRLALLALAGTYGKGEVIASGPIFKRMEIEAEKLRLLFDNAKGLASRDGKALSWFEVIDAEEGGFVPAEAKIEGSTVVLSAPEVRHPVAMRFAWSMLAEPNLMNGAGLPASAFRAGNVPKRDLLTLKVPEAKNYKLVYDIDLAKLGPNFACDTDNASNLTGSFDRIAYCLELQPADGQTQFVYVSMDAFTDSSAKIGIPTVQCGARFQQNVANMNVYSNVKGIVTGTALAGGNIEFWPNNYGPANSGNVPGASGQVYDFGDEPADPSDGYGSMQVHNHDAKQTLFAVNHWREGEKADLGIGNQSQGNPDWTFAGNAGSYKSKRLRVLVRLK